MSVVGYDDSRIARISYINLTTVGQNPLQLAHLAVHRAIDRLENRQPNAATKWSHHSSSSDQPPPRHATEIPLIRRPGIGTACRSNITGSS